MSGLSKPFPAYKGDEPFVFVCYAHSDAETVYADLIELDGNGIRLWYDEGIGAGQSWRAEIAAAIKSAEKLLFFISAASLASAHCLREVDYALHHDIDIVPVYLDDTKLPGELELVLNRVQALFRPTDARYMAHLVSALQSQEPIARVLSHAKRSGPRKWLLLAVGVVLVAVLALTQMDRHPPTRQGVSNVASGPTEFDQYLEGLKLLERWDKDDNLDRAIKLFREAISNDPDFALAYARLADGLRIRYVLTSDEAALDEATNYAEEAVRLNDALAPVQIVLSRVQALQGNNDLAFAAVERALAIDPNDADANREMAKMQARRGLTEQAEASFKKAIALDSENIATFNAYGNFLMNQSRFDEAAQQWQTVIRLAPDHYPTLVNLGAVLTELNRLAEAITMYQRAIEIKPSYMAWSNLGTVYSRAGRYEEAVTAYRKALEIDDSDWMVWGNLSWVLYWLDPESQEGADTITRAIELAEAARQKDPRDIWAHSDLALYYARTGEYKLAKQRLETAVALAPNSGEILAAAAEAWELMGDRDKAVEFAKRSLESGYTRQLMGRNAGLANLMNDPRLAEKT